MKLLLDMNLSPDWVELLRDNGYEAQHWSELGAADATDQEILAAARSQGFVLFTHDLDFGRLLALTRAQGPSVIQLRGKEVMPAAVGDRTLEALRACESPLRAGALVVVDSTTWRARLLPL